MLACAVSIRLARLGSFLPIFRGGHDCAPYPLLRRFPVNAVHFHKRLNGELDKIISRSAHLLVRIGLLVLSSHVRFLVLLNLGQAKSARFYVIWTIQEVLGMRENKHDVISL